MVLRRSSFFSDLLRRASRWSLFRQPIEVSRGFSLVVLETLSWNVGIKLGGLMGDRDFGSLGIGVAHILVKAIQMLSLISLGPMGS